MRGKATRHIRSIDTVGITPAYAGKSQIFQLALLQPEDHPRLCGEKANPPAAMIFRIGSPPPMRGKGEVSAEKFCITGITPAYAGKS